MTQDKNKTNWISGNILLTCILMFFPLALYSQADKKFIRQGNREYEKNNFSDSEVSFRKAIDKNKGSPDAVFNAGDALYKQNKYEDAGKLFIENTSMNDDKERKSAGLYNLGNSLLMSKKVEESIEAYKSSLKLYPDNPKAKYNLAYAQDLLKQQQEEQKQQQQQEKDKQDQNKDKNKEDQEKDKQDQKDQKDQNNKSKDQPKDQNKDQDQQQQQGISKDDAQRLLNALANDEKNVQEKVKLAKAAKARVRTVKNW